MVIQEETSEDSKQKLELGIPGIISIVGKPSCFRRVGCFQTSDISVVEELDVSEELVVSKRTKSQ